MVTSLFIFGDLANLVIGIWMFRIWCNEREKEIGTARFIPYFFINCIIGCILLTIWYWLFVQFFSVEDYFEVFNIQQPIWCLIMCEMVIMNMKDPETYFVTWGCRTVKKKYFHWVFTLFFSVFWLCVIIDCVAGIFIGYLHYWGFMSWTIMPTSFGAGADDCFLFRGLAKIGNYRHVDESLLGNDDARSEGASSANSE
jgi:hypothetical protein